MAGSVVRRMQGLARTGGTPTRPLWLDVAERFPPNHTHGRATPVPKIAWELTQEQQLRLLGLSEPPRPSSSAAAAVGAPAEAATAPVTTGATIPAGLGAAALAARKASVSSNLGLDRPAAAPTPAPAPGAGPEATVLPRETEADRYGRRLGQRERVRRIEVTNRRACRTAVKAASTRLIRGTLTSLDEASRAGGAKTP